MPPLTNAEKVRRYQERKRVRLESAPDLTRPYLATPFHEYMTNGGWSDVQSPLGLIGLAFQPFTDDSGARELAASIDDVEARYKFYDRYAGSVGRAEFIVGNLLDAAVELAKHINAYKKQQLDEAIERLSRDLPADVTARKDALAELVKLTKLREQLDTSRRIEVRQYELKQEVEQA